jgi:hypothetical protein
MLTSADSLSIPARSQEPDVTSGRLHATVERVSVTRRLPLQRSDLAMGPDLVRLTESLLAAPDLEALKERYLAGFGRVLGVQVNGFDLVDPETTRQTFSAHINVSDAFLACYRRGTWTVDPLRAAVYATGRPESEPVHGQPACQEHLPQARCGLPRRAYAPAARLPPLNRLGSSRWPGFRPSPGLGMRRTALICGIGADFGSS